MAKVERWMGLKKYVVLAAALSAGCSDVPSEVDELAPSANLELQASQPVYAQYFVGRYQSFDRATQVTLAVNGSLQILRAGVLQGGDYTCRGSAPPLQCDLRADFTQHTFRINDEFGEAVLDDLVVLRVYDWAGSFAHACELSGGRVPTREPLRRCICPPATRIFAPFFGGCSAPAWRPF
jgi:hypothetical protein